jgi:endogenous inhibitor of DNA gyrase (YacG/DUF329 family)
MKLREKAPENCPRCGHDPTGDDEEFTSGGGWVHDHDVDGARWTERFRCPVCRKTVAKTDERMA